MLKFFQNFLFVPLFEVFQKSLGMNMLDFCNLIGEIVSLSKKACFFYHCAKKIFCC